MGTKLAAIVLGLGLMCWGACEEVPPDTRDADCKQACIDQGPSHGSQKTVSGWGWSSDQDLCKCLTEYRDDYILNKKVSRPAPRPNNEWEKKPRN